MAQCVHFQWTFKVGYFAPYNKLPREVKRELRMVNQPDSKIRQNLGKIADSKADDMAKHWRVLLSPELKRCERAAREEARSNAYEQCFNLMYEQNLMRAVWCSVQYERGFMSAARILR